MEKILKEDVEDLYRLEKAGQEVGEMISIVVPCFNEQETLPVFYQEICRIFRQMGRGYELIFIDDGSLDATLSLIKSYAGADENVTYLSFSRNFGKEAAMYAGFCNARGDYVAVMDADMQDPPSLLPEMLQIIEEEGYDSVATRRATRTGEPPLRSWLARCFYKLINRISDVDIVDGARDFRLMKRSMVDAIIAMEEYNRFSKGIFGWIGFKTYWLPFENVERVAGKTKWNGWKLFRYAFDGITDFSQIPLRIASWLGIGMTGFSFLMVIFLVIRRLCFGDPVAGWASTVCIIIFLGGVQLFCIGLMGQYVAKIFMESKHRPHYIISETDRDAVKKVR